MPALACLPAEVSIIKSTPVLPTLGEEHLRFLGESVSDCPCSSSVVVAEGIPPLPQKTVDKIQKWEYVDLATLLSNELPTGESSMITVNGQTLIVNPPENQTKKCKVILDLHSWMQAYSAYAAGLTSAEETTKPESAGLLAHMYICPATGKRFGGNPMGTARQGIQGVGSS